MNNQITTIEESLIKEIVEIINDLFQSKDYIITYKLLKIENKKDTWGIIITNEKLYNNSPIFNPTPLIEEGYSPEIIANVIYHKYTNEDLSTLLNNNLDLQNFDISNFDSIKKNLRLKILTSNQSESFLNQTPHTNFLDFIIVPFLIINDSNIIEITNDMLKTWNIKTEDLIDIAQKNMQGKYNIIDIVDYFSSNVKKKYLEISDIDLIQDSIQNLYVLTSYDNIYGAYYFSDKNALDKICNLVQKDIILFPCSLHEIYIIPKNDNLDINFIKDLINYMYLIEVEEENQLTNEIYLYSKANGWERL